MLDYNNACHRPSKGGELVGVNLCVDLNTMLLHNVSNHAAYDGAAAIAVVYHGLLFRPKGL